MQGLQGDQLIGAPVSSLVQTVQAGVGHHGGDGELIDDVSHAAAAQRRKRAGARDLVDQAACVETDHPQHQCGGVVVTAARQGGIDQGLARLLGAADAGQLGEPALFDHAMHAVGGEHVGVSGLHLALQIVDAQAVVQSDRARQATSLVGMRKCMVLSQQLQIVAVDSPQSGVAHMGHGVALALQHQRGQRCQRGGAGGIRPLRRVRSRPRALTLPVLRHEPGVLRADQAVQRDGGVPGGRRREEIGEQAHDAGLRCLLASPSTRNAVGDRRDQAARRFMGSRTLGADEVFIEVARAALAAVPDFYFKAHAAIVIVRHRVTGHSIFPFERGSTRLEA